MACCIFVAFVIGQLYALYDLVAAAFCRRRAAVVRDRIWRLGDLQLSAAPAAASSGSSFGLLTLVVIELALAAAATNWLVSKGGGHLLGRELGRLGEVRSVADLRDLCGL